jgi:hypothetical protein
MASRRRGVARCFRPLPSQRPCALVPSSTSSHRKPTSSETRRPVWIATRSSVRSRRPIQVEVSGAASKASISVGSRNAAGRRAYRLFGMAKTRWQSKACVGSFRATCRKHDRWPRAACYANSVSRILTSAANTRRRPKLFRADLQRKPSDGGRPGGARHNRGRRIVLGFRVPTPRLAVDSAPAGRVPTRSRRPTSESFGWAGGRARPMRRRMGGRESAFAVSPRAGKFGHGGLR